MVRVVGFHVLASTVLAMMVVGCIVSKNTRRPDERAACRRQLQVLACTVDLYCQLHDGQFPGHLIGGNNEHLPVSGFIPWPQLILICPGTGRDQTGKGEMKEEDIDYVYVNWSRWYKTSEEVPGEYPLAYDRRLANHAGQGVNVVAVDRHAFWDPDAKWLRNFAQNHPEYDIPLSKE